MPRSETNESSRASEATRSTEPEPGHFALHKPGVHLESCCGLCNLFPGVLLLAFAQALSGAVLLTALLVSGDEYDYIHDTVDSQVVSVSTGAVLSAVTGSGLLLAAVALSESCRAMLIYLLVAAMVWLSIVSLAVAKVTRACPHFHDAPKIKDEQHRLTNLACVSGLLTFLGAVLYLFSFAVVFSFYHFRYVRRAVLLHEAGCR